MTDYTFFIILVAMLAAALYIAKCQLLNPLLIVREVINGKSHVRQYVMMERTDKKTKTSYWVSVPWQGRLRTPSPPREVRDTGSYGRLIVEAYKLGKDEYCWIQDCGTQKTSLLRKDEKILSDAFEPFSTTARAALVDELARAATYEKNDSWKRPEFIIPAAAMTALLMFAALVFVFGGELIGAYNSAQAQNAQIAQDTFLIQQQNVELAREMGIVIQQVRQTSGQAEAGESIIGQIGGEVDDLLGGLGP